MDWEQACAYWDNGAISTADLYRLAHEMFTGVALDDVLADIAYTDLAAQPFIEPPSAPAPAGR